MPSPPRTPAALREATDAVFWTDRPGAPEPAPRLTAGTDADLVVVGGGLTGLWAAIESKRTDPGRDVVLVEGASIGSGASARNGGFISESLTHGLAHGTATWPDELAELVRLGRENLKDIREFLQHQRIDAQLALHGKSVVAVEPHQLAGLDAAYRLHLAHGERAELLDQDRARADVRSPTYLGALRVRSGGGTVDPALLCWGLVRAAAKLGVRKYERSPITGLERSGAGVLARTAHAAIRAHRLVLATNAYPPLLHRLRSWVLPVLDHVLVTEPLTSAQRESIGWREEQGLTDPGNRFHYYRLTADGRILFGGYDATYHYGGGAPADSPARQDSYARLARHFQATFPQLEGLRFTHRWFGMIDTTSRFTPVFGTALDGRVSYAVGYTGLGVGASRFGARIALDLVDGRDTERTRLRLVTRRPVPFPPEPVRYPLVRLTQAALAREDRTGRRGAYLRLLDRLGVGFTS